VHELTKLILGQGRMYVGNVISICLLQNLDRSHDGH
jgi:hypothetical protein